MNIVIVIDAFDVHSNGTSVSAQRFCKRFIARGHNVKVVCAGDGKGDFDAGKFRVPFFQDIIDKQGSMIAKSGKKVLKKALTDADIVHVYQPFPLECKALKLAKQRNIPVVGAFHMHPENVLYSLHLEKVPFLKKGLYWLFNIVLYRHTPHIHCPSKFIADQLEENGYKSKLHVISNGVSQAFCPGDAQRLECWEDKFVILSIGRLSREKRHDVLISAVKKSKYRDKIYIVMAGCGPEFDNLNKLADKFNINIKFEYFKQKDLVNIMRSCDLYVHCADVEIEGIACIEAISCGLNPIISNSKDSAAKQFAMTNDNLFEHGNADELAKKIDYWYEKDEERKLSGARHAFFVSKKYDIKSSIDAILNIYEIAIAEGKKTILKNDMGTDIKPDTHITKSWTPLNKKINKKTNIINFNFPFVFLSNLLKLFAIPLLMIINRAFHGLKIDGMKKLRKLKGKGAITVANHVHTLDSTFLSLGMFPRKMQFSSIKSNFEIPVIRWIVRLLGGFPIPENMAGMLKFAKDIGRALDKGQLIHFYPEAALWPYHEKLRPFKNGAFRFAVQFNAPILPCVIVFKERKFRKPAAKLIILDAIFPLQKNIGSIIKRTDMLKDITYEKMNEEIEKWYEVRHHQIEDKAFIK